MTPAARTISPEAVDPDDVAARLVEVRRRIAAAGGDGLHIRIVAVTKGFGPDAVRAALAAGLCDMGENYADELLTKHAHLGGGVVDPSTAEHTTGPSGPVATGSGPSDWHFLGRVQRNKVKGLAPVVGLWQTVDRAAAGHEIAQRAPGARVLVQINASGRAERNGCDPADTPALVDELRAMELDVVGLMAVGPNGPPEHARTAFRHLATMADRLELRERSMGMTDDLEVAVEEGTTMVRVGRALFGARPVPTDQRR